MGLEVDATVSAPGVTAAGFVVGAQVAGRYRIVRSLGTGGMGEVFAVDDLVVDARVALKALRADRTAPTMIERLRRELTLARKVTHRNVCRIHDLGDHEGRVFLTMELLDGETLADRIEHGPFALDAALAVVDQLVLGLAAAHAAGIVHRDFKSSNVMLVGGDRPRAVVTDFGLARSEVADEHVDLTGDAAMLGTAAYMAPEQVEGKPATTASDVYALGVVMFEMITGVLPFRGESPLATASLRLTSDPPSVRSLRPDVAPAWEATIARCLARRPAERFARVEDVSASLRRKVPPSPAARCRRAIAAGVVGVIAVAAASGAVGYRLRRAAPATRAPAPALASPTFVPVTFRRGIVLNARFAPDGSIVYSAAWNGEPVTIYSAQPGHPEARALFAPGVQLFSIASDGRVALAVGVHLGERAGTGTLAVASLAGEAPRPIVEDVVAADWLPQGDRPAVVRRGGRKFVVEFPYGRQALDYGDFVDQIRVSRDGARAAITVSDHGDSSILLLDATGASRVLVAKWQGIYRIAWSADGRELWFTGQRFGDREPALHATDLDGHVREPLGAPGALVIHDIAADGRVLLATYTYTTDVAMRRPGAPDRPVSWFDRTQPAAISDAGDAYLFNDHGAAYVRRLDGSPAVKLIDSVAAALSPDGTLALAWQFSPTTPGQVPEQLVIVPTGPGPTRSLLRGAIEIYRNAAFSPDGRQIVTEAIEPGPDRRSRLYLQDLDGEPRAVTPLDTEFPSMTAQPLSADGRWVLAMDGSRTVRMFPIAGGPARDIPGWQRTDRPLRWSRDGRIFIARPAGLSVTIHSVDPTTGDWRELYTIAPADPAGVDGPPDVVITPDGRTCVYTVARGLSKLYVVEGLR